MSEYSEADQCADRHDNDGGRRGPHHRIPHLDLHNARTSAWVLLATSAMALGAFLTADDKMTAAALAVAAVLLGWASASERGEWLERAIARVVEGATPQGSPEPDPVPEWRRLVDAQARLHQGESNPLGHALLMLSDLTSYAHDDRARTCLARIVAVCEAQVGGGWQAEPTPPCELGDLLYVLADVDGNVMWRQIGEAAAAWLRDITEATLLREQHEAEGADLDVWRGVWS